MGFPAFFRWLSKKYPSIVTHCVEEKKRGIDGEAVPLDTSLPNPNEYEFDNLYLDMNGIIHPCSHPENKPAPKNEAEMMVNIFEYIDRIFSICRPRKLLYMAIDGVAPRAKMNQQRSRRFRAAKDSKESKQIIHDIKQKLLEKGCLLPPEPEKKESFDSNCITQGTDIMDRLSVCLRFYIADRLSHDPGWKNVKVILSDANVPGEGEHKIMDYIRKQRAQPDHDPNTKHCLNGADADLIMLGLATHELHFTIIREEFKPGQKKPCEICAQAGHDKSDCEGLPKEKVSENDEIQPFVAPEVEFIFIRLFVLREYLERELRMDGLSFYNFERALDDWVFMCFFVGNDFLPHLPSLEIREGAIDRLVNIYKKALPLMGGYLADSGFVEMSRVQIILKELGGVEDEIFRRRQQNEENFQRRRKQQEERNKRQRREGSDGPGWSPSNYASPLGRGQSPSSSFHNSPSHKQFYQGQRTPEPNRNKMAANDLRNMLLTPNPDGAVDSPKPGEKRKHEQVEEKKKEPEAPQDHIRLYEEGWRSRYYLHKFNVDQDDDPEYFKRFTKHVADEYVLGLCWVLRYYYQGCPSWKWFYPFHYAPFASDFVDIVDVDTNFEKGTGPFRPLEQLMSVFPAASGKFLPPTWRALMSSPDSEIIDCYPCDFKIDLNGKKMAWQGVALLPFVDEKRLHRALSQVYGDLTEDETRRNTNRQDNIMFVGKGNGLFDFITGLNESNMLKEGKQDIVTDFSNGQRGKIFYDDKVVMPGSFYPCPVPGQEDISSVQSISVRYEDPEYDEDFKFLAKPLEKCTPPERVVKPGDFPQDKVWRPKLGMGNRNFNPNHVSPGGQRMLRHELGMNNRGSPRGGYSPQNNRFRSPGGPGSSPHGGSRWGPPNSYNSPPPQYGYGTPPRGGGGGGYHRNNHQQGGGSWGGNSWRGGGGGGHHRSQSHHERSFDGGHHQNDPNRRRSYSDKRSEQRRY